MLMVTVDGGRTQALKKRPKNNAIISLDGKGMVWVWEEKMQDLAQRSRKDLERGRSMKFQSSSNMTSTATLILRRTWWMGMSGWSSLRVALPSFGNLLSSVLV